MIDSYMWGEISRMSPEAPVPIVTVSKKENRLGGAANVALNIQALGANPILCSIIGDDQSGNEVIDLLKKQNLSQEGIIQAPYRPTTVKTRIIAADKHALRVDEEIEADISVPLQDALFQTVSKLISSENIDAILFEDYNKGVLTKTIIERIIQLGESNGIPTVADPKKKNFLSYNNITLFKPNLKELNEGLAIEVDPDDPVSLNNGLELLKKEIDFKNALITLSEHGIAINDGSKTYTHPAYKRNILDVSGAGDTVLSVAALCLALNVSKEIIANLSNLAGGLVCEQVGVVPIDKIQLRKEANILISR
ncbi:MAG: D-glycero-beta-D-manno-heptose-7-phosphate kinase [Flavobacteriales bacterium]|nr:D-glycero-beta-D-manno-heptose-7-phosphate kinase [Flavobacteriales bacterium]